jgi:hypothetical protein
MRARADTTTRRQFLRRTAVLAAGAASAGAGAEALAAVLARTSSAAPPLTPSWHTRPDLRIPALTVLRRDAAASSDPVLIAPYNAPDAQAGAVIVDAGGTPLGENPVPERVTTNFTVQSYRGSPVLTWWEGLIELGHGVGEYVIADSAYRTVRRVQAGNRLRGDLHEFVITPRETALLTSYVVRRADLRSVGGPRDGTIQDAIFQELDLRSGGVLLEWHSLDHIPLSESYAPVTSDWDFFHINSVSPDDDGGLLVSARSTHTIYKIDRHGTIVWRLGGAGSDFTMGPGSTFAWQHDARRQPDGTITVFDNGATPAVEKLSRGLILDVDEQAMTASLARQYTHPRVLTGSQGSMQLLPGGNAFVGWGETPRVSEFDAGGRIVFDALLGSRYQSYRAFRLPWTGAPADAPAIAADTRPSRRTVYVSWNGATEVRTWQLLSGSSAATLAPLASVAARGFETAIPAHGAGPWVAVRALDTHGAELGASQSLSLSA